MKKAHPEGQAFRNAVWQALLRRSDQIEAHCEVVVDEVVSEVVEERA